MRCRRCGSEMAVHTLDGRNYMVCRCGQGAPEWQTAQARWSSARMTGAQRRQQSLNDLREQLRWYLLNPSTPARDIKKRRVMAMIAELENECDQIGQEAS